MRTSLLRHTGTGQCQEQTARHCCGLDLPLHPSAAEAWRDAGVRLAAKNGEAQITAEEQKPVLLSLKTTFISVLRSGTLSANVGRLDGQAGTAWDPAGGAHERLLVKCFERLGAFEGPRISGRDPHYARKVGQRHQAVEAARLSGEQHRHRRENTGYSCFQDYSMPRPILLLIGVGFCKGAKRSPALTFGAWNGHNRERIFS